MIFRFIGLSILAAFLSTPATLHDGKCSACEKWHVKSTVTMDGMGSCTLLACTPGHYDEDGNWVAGPPCNTCTFSGHCSRGHVVYAIEKGF